jgi:EAL domain-containing protein (putative c-di-GMP-specific phosphodiesterase class I)
VAAGIVGIARELNITVLAEGIETEAEFLVLKEAGIRLFQGYWFAKPAFEVLPQIEPWPVLTPPLSLGTPL